MVFFLLLDRLSILREKINEMIEKINETGKTRNEYETMLKLEELKIKPCSDETTELFNLVLNGYLNNTKENLIFIGYSFYNYINVNFKLKKAIKNEAANYEHKIANLTEQCTVDINNRKGFILFRNFKFEPYRIIFGPKF